MNEPKRGRTGKAVAGAALAIALLLESAVALAGGVVVEIIDGRKAKADITLPKPGGGNYTAEFEIEFERDGLENLTVECLGLTADVLDANEIDAINHRLPHGAQTPSPTQAIDPAFPVRITVEPPSACGLAFQNGYDVEIDTPDLVFEPGSKYRLVKAPIGGLFQYVTGAVTAGSVRVRGGGGGFSEFVMIKDSAPSYAADCNDEYEIVETRLRTAQLSPTARRTLELDLQRSRSAYEAGDLATAISLLAPFDGHCVEFAGDGLPNRWRSLRDLDNVEGEIVGRTENLRFMMGRLSGSP